MKALSLLLALAISAGASATPSHGVPMKDVWKAKSHRDLVHCAGFYSVSAAFFKDVKPEAARDANELKDGAIYFVAQLRVPEAESDRHLAEFREMLKRDYGYAGAYPKLFGDYAKKCDVTMNTFVEQYGRFYGIPK